MTQSDALTILKAGYNVFLTGSAGSGKTYTLNQYIQYLKDHAIPVAVTASTGIAATHIGGTTIHAWTGMGIRDTMNDAEIEALLEKEYLFKHFKHTKVLVIDEISMLGGKRLDLVHRICKAFKQNDLPFGGLQVVVCGDFFQLPPIDANDRFAFDSTAWREAEFKICYLEEQYRHTDGELYDLLNAVRSGTINEYHESLLTGRNEYDLAEHIEPTRLYTHNADVDAINAEELDKLAGAPHSYPMHSRGKLPLVEALKKSCLAPETLVLKKGALVMFVKNNYEQGFVNGTMGRVTGFDRDDTPIIETFSGQTIIPEMATWAIEEHGKVLAEISQLPVRLAWAMTIHKSQGMSLDAAEIDLSKAFVAGQGYVALSRVRTLAGLFLKGINDIALSVHPDIRSRDGDFKKDSHYTVGSLAGLSTHEVTLLHTDFIVQTGGNLVPTRHEKKEKKTSTSTYHQTRELLLARHSLADIARIRKLGMGTVIQHIEKLCTQEPDLAIDYLRGRDQAEIAEMFDRLGTEALKPVFDYFDGRYSYDELKLARIFMHRERG